MTPIQMAAKVLVRAGVAMVILSLLCRLAGLTGGSAIVDDLAILASLGVVATGILAQYVDRRRDAAADRNTD